VPVHRVSLPDGSVLRIEAPAGVDPEALQAFAEQQYTAQQAPREAAPRPWYDPKGLAATVGSGITLGLNDEIAGGIGALGSLLPGSDRGFGEAYTQDRDAIRRLKGEYAADNPVTSVGAELVGGLATGGAGAERALAKEGWQRGLGMLGLGAAAGATEGVGNAPNVEAVPGAMAKGMMWGAGGAAIAPAVARAGTAGGRMLQRAWDAATQSSDDAAQQALRNLLSESGLDMSTFAQRMHALGPDALVADLHEGAQSKLRALAADDPNLRAKARNILDPRNELAHERLTSDAHALMQVPSVRFHTALRELDAARRTEANDLYGPIYDEILPVNEDFQEIMQRPSIKKGYEAALRNAMDAGDTLGMQIGSDGKIVIAPTLRDIDRVKHGIDDVIRDNSDLLTGKVNSTGRSAVRAKRTLIDYVESADPVIGDAYRKARQTYAGYSALEDAMRRGKRIFREEAEDTAYMLDNASESEREAFKLGAFNAVRDEIETAKLAGNPSKRASFNSPKFRRRLRHAFDSDEEFNSFMASIKRELDFGETHQKATGVGESPTARIQAEQKALADETGAHTVREGISVPGMILKGLDAIRRVGEPSSTRATRARDELSNLLLSRRMPALGKPAGQRYEMSTATGLAGLVAAGGNPLFSGSLDYSNQ